jgi:uracil-DNA glycosylase
MPWDERQRRMLEAMGLRVWQPVAPAPPVPPAAGEPAAAPASDVNVQPQAASLRARSPAASPAPNAAPAPATPPAGPPATDVAALDWPALRETVAACRACSLCESRRQTVFGVGSPRARWLIVGEAPGEQEDREGEPFVGAAGRMLDRMLHALQLTRAADGPENDAQRVYIANTLKCRPPANRNPAPDELAKCLPYLERQITLLQPRLILAMGRFAVQALLGSDQAIGKLRGRVHRPERFGATPVIVTYHPSYLLRSPLEKAKAWEDLCLAAETFDSTGP